MTLVRLKQKPFFNNFSDDLFQNIPSLFREHKDAFPFKHSVPVNVIESESGYKLEVVAPGLSKEDFKVELDKNLLTVSFEKKTGEEQNTEKFIRKEYSIQSFKRSFTVSDNIDADNISAQFVNGILTLNLPIKAEVKASSKQITIE
jgi:HSP20 family protein